MRRAFAVSVIVAGATAVVLACGGADTPGVVFVPPERIDAALMDAPVDAEEPVPDATALPVEVASAPEASEPLPADASYVAVSFAAMRRHPELSRIGPILGKLPAAAEANAAGLDVLRDLDSFVAYGPSLIHTERSIALVSYHVADKVVDAAVAAAAAKVLARPHGPWDAGVPGAKATIGWNDGAARVFVRPQSHLLAVLPPTVAQAEIASLMKTPPAAPPADEAIRMRFRKPKRQISIPGIPIPETLDELRFWVVPSASGGADVHVEGDCATEDAAKELAITWTDATKKANSTMVRFATRNLLGQVAFAADKRKVHTHLAATHEQVIALLELVAAATGVTLPAPRDAGP